jgi:hypothetical protein
MVLQVFLFHRILPLMARLALMWEYLESGDQSMVVEGHLLKESVMGIAWMVLGSTSREPIVDEGPTPFSVFESRSDDLPYLGAVSIPPATRGSRPRLPSGVLPCHRGCVPHPVAGCSPSSWATGKHPCSSSFGVGAPSWKRHSTLRLSSSGR